MKLFLMIVCFIFLCYSAERKEKEVLINCDTTSKKDTMFVIKTTVTCDTMIIVRTLKDTTKVVKIDTLKLEKPKKKTKKK